MLGHLVFDLLEQLTTGQLSLRRLEHDLHDGGMLLVEIAATVAFALFVWLRLARRGLSLRFVGCRPELLKLGAHIVLCTLVALFGASERIEHRPEDELYLGRVDGLSLLTEQLSLEPLELVEHERVQLAVLLPLVLGALTHLGLQIMSAPNACKLGFEHGDTRLEVVITLCCAVAHAGGSVAALSLIRKAFSRARLTSAFARCLRVGGSTP